jgi:prophage regulatory protein
MTKDIKLVASNDPDVQDHKAPGSQLRILRREDVCRIVGIDKSTLFRLRKAGHFPRPIRLGGNSIAWVESEVVDWLASRPRLNY